MTGSVKHIVLVTTTHLSTNPRLVKEANALSASGYRVTVLFCYTIEWGFHADREILRQATFSGKMVGGSPFQNRLRYHFSRFRRKICARTVAIPACLARAYVRAYDELLAAASVLEADLYIGHNLGALPVVAAAAKKRSVRYAFDAEDFHREETVSDTRAGKTNLKRILEERYFPGAAYITVASPLIGDAYRNCFPQKPFIVINNVFSVRDQPVLSFRREGPLRLLWFSQTIGMDRGIADILKAMERIGHLPIRLTLLGRCGEAQKSFFQSQTKSPLHVIRVLGPVQPDHLFSLATDQDIGLALEPGFSTNNHIALSNKIFTYLLSGIAIIASETLAQRKFLQEYPEVGLSYPIGDYKTLAKHLEFYYFNREALHQAQRNAWQLAHDTLNWEVEQQAFLSEIVSLWH